MLILSICRQFSFSVLVVLELLLTILSRRMTFSPSRFFRMRPGKAEVVQKADIVIEEKAFDDLLVDDDCPALFWGDCPQGSNNCSTELSQRICDVLETMPLSPQKSSSNTIVHKSSSGDTPKSGFESAAASLGFELKSDPEMSSSSRKGSESSAFEVYSSKARYHHKKVSPSICPLAILSNNEETLFKAWCSVGYLPKIHEESVLDFQASPCSSSKRLDLILQSSELATTPAPKHVVSKESQVCSDCNEDLCPQSTIPLSEECPCKGESMLDVSMGAFDFVSQLYFDTSEKIWSTGKRVFNLKSWFGSSSQN